MDSRWFRWKRNQEEVVEEIGGGRRGGRDPLAQSFTVDGTGMNLTSVDLFFGTKDPIEKLTVELDPWNWELLLDTS